MYLVSAYLSISLAYNIFTAVTKGVSANMLKITSKRRRSLKQIKAEKEAAAQEAAEKEAKLAQFE